MVSFLDRHSRESGNRWTAARKSLPFLVIVDSSFRGNDGMSGSC
jgi:hypothetical protein